MLKKFSILPILALCFCSLCACSTQQTQEVPQTSLDKLDMSKWNYNSQNDVYYQIGISYCENPADSAYETLSVFVPGAFFSATQNDDGTYSAAINSSALVNGYSPSDAPIVMPVDTPGYSAQKALTAYKDVSEYTNAGYVYVHAGCRGRDAGAPAGVTDMKAAIRYLRYTKDELPATTEHIYVFGMSGGGAQSSIIGASGDSDLYTPYLEQIGAVKGVSDAVYGAMCWCPITNLDSADEAYEWMMGSSRSNLSSEDQAISDALASAFASYINSAGIVDENGNKLTLDESDSGIYQAGSYYDYLKNVIETSLNNFLKNTTFPYSPSSSVKGVGPSGDEFLGKNTDLPNNLPEKGEGMRGGNKTAGSQETRDNVSRTNTSSTGVTLSGTYNTVEDYINALNAKENWVTYDESTNTATISSISDFAKAVKNVAKELGAFDQFDGGQAENTLFGYGDGQGAHFDKTLKEILEEQDNTNANAYEQDLQKTDSVGNTVETRLNMYTPLYYLLPSQPGYQTSTVAKVWRIRTGLFQSDTALSTEVNLALALENYPGVDSVDFQTIWGLPHVEAETSGTSTENFIAWVKEEDK